jgi:hypothetical protein
MARRIIHIGISLVLAIVAYFLLDYSTSNQKITTCTVKLSSKNKEIVQIFYEFDSTFTEEIAFNKPIKPLIIEELTFSIPDIDSLERIRIDLGTSINSWQLYEIKIKTNYEDIVLNADSISKCFYPTKDIGNFELQNNYVQIVTSGADPFIISKFSLTDLLASANKTNPNKWKNILISVGLFILVFLFLYFTKTSVNKPDSNQILQKTFVISFVICISVPMVFMYLPGTYSAKETENTQAPQKPQLQLKEINKFIKEYHIYFERSFAYRNELITLNSFIQYKFFKASTQPEKVLVGKSNWLYPTEEGIVDDVKREKPFTADEIKLIADNFKRVQHYCDSLHIKFYVALLPNKYTVYPEFLPNRFHIKNQPSKREQIVIALEQNGVKVIDPTEELLKAKPNAEVYYRYDTHWNFQGGFIGYQKLISEIKKDFPQIEELKNIDFNNEYKISYNGDLAKLIGMENILPNNEWMMYPKNKKTWYDGKVTDYISYNSPYKAVYNETSDTIMPRGVMFRDSYSNMMIPFLSENFSRSVFLWTNVILKEVLEKEKPDLVIFEIVEDKLHMYTNLSLL